MIATDEDALICDFAETYHIYDYRALPTAYVAALACGLPEKSRIKVILSGVSASTDTLLLAAIADRLGLMLCGKQYSDSIANALLEGRNKENDSTMKFSSGEEFEAARKKLIEGGDT